MYRKTLMIFALCGFTALAGCGTKGPLYIPEQRYPQPAQQEAPATPPASQAN